MHDRRRGVREIRPHLIGHLPGVHEFLTVDRDGWSTRALQRLCRPLPVWRVRQVAVKPISGRHACDVGLLRASSA